jgi:hypothetical protein
MTDQNDTGQTARLVDDITRAYHQRAADPDTRPVTYREASEGSIVDQIGRYRQLADRDVMARAIATLRSRGTYKPSEHVNEEEFPPLTLPELLKMLALGEAIARYYRHPCHVDHAVRAGATWEEIAAATDAPPGAARAAYRAWAEGQHRYGYMEDVEYATALELAGHED